MASKKRRNSDSLSDENDEGEAKKLRGENTSKTLTGAIVSDLRVTHAGNDSLVLEWTNPSAEATTYTVSLSSATETTSQSILANSSSKACKVEFTDLKPLTKYEVSLSTPEKSASATTLKTMTRPSLEMPEIEEVKVGCVHLTLAPLPEGESKDVEGYLLLLRPLEDVKDHPKDGVENSSFKIELESVVKPPFYIAYEFTQEQLSEDDGGQVQIGSDSPTKVGKYGPLQDPKLQSGGFYRAVFVVIINSEGKQKLYAEESCRILIK